MLEDLPISIITPSLNRASMIGEAIESVLAQDYPHVEHIIMDGGSTDGTLEVLKRYPHLRVVSEKDEGLYDAINKGIALAGGEIIGVLNTDDYYAPRIFGQIAGLFTELPQIEAVSGGSVVFALNSTGQKSIILEHTCIHSDQLLLRATIGESSFNAWFFRKPIFQEMGGLDLRYRLLADREFLIRFALCKKMYRVFNQVIYNYRQHPGSLTMNTSVKVTDPIGEEALSIAERYIQQDWLDPNERRTLQNWHTHISIGQTLISLHESSLTKSIQHAARGLKYDSRWSVQFLKIFPPRMVRLIIKKLKGPRHGTA